jgi:pimeloyl-ACP methyl ester carboxylesterase
MISEVHDKAARLKFEESDLDFPGAGIRLGGTLTLPAGLSQGPAVVFAHGSGPLDRDETSIGKRPFRVLAHYLARHGVASLRFDKRGVGDSGGSFAAATANDFVDDVLAGVHYLRDLDTLSANLVGIVGHSEGGMTALRAAARSRSVAFCALLAGPALSGKENLTHFLAHLATRGFDRDETFHKLRLQIRTLVDAIRSEGGFVADQNTLNTANGLAQRINSPSSREIFGGCSEMSGEDFIELLSSSCLDCCMSWEPETVIPSVTCAVLALYGSRDVQVPAEENIREAERIFGPAPAELTVREIADANHLFQTCRTGMPDEYASSGQAPDEGALEEVTAWILQQVGRIEGPPGERPGLVHRAAARPRM